jgi:RNA recognition motif-containing protein
MEYKKIINNISPEEKQKISGELLTVLRDPSHSVEDYNEVFERHLGFTLDDFITNAWIENVKQFKKDFELGGRKMLTNINEDLDNSNIDEILTDLANRLYSDEQITEQEYSVLVYSAEKLRKE